MTDMQDQQQRPIQTCSLPPPPLKLSANITPPTLRSEGRNKETASLVMQYTIILHLPHSEVRKQQGKNWCHFAYSHFAYLLLLSAVSTTHAKCDQNNVKQLKQAVQQIYKVKGIVQKRKRRNKKK